MYEVFSSLCLCFAMRGYNKVAVKKRLRRKEKERVVLLQEPVSSQ
jgi:hypothetical protein